MKKIMLIFTVLFVVANAHAWFGVQLRDLDLNYFNIDEVDTLEVRTIDAGNMAIDTFTIGSGATIKKITIGTTKIANSTTGSHVFGSGFNTTDYVTFQLYGATHRDLTKGLMSKISTLGTGYILFDAVADSAALNGATVGYSVTSWE